MSKLPNIFKTNNVVLSQGLHTQDWAGGYYNAAIDFSYIDNLICPFDNCEVVTYSNSFPENIRQSYFGLKLPDGNVILIVHAKPVKMGKLKKGESFAYCTWHHYHLAMLIDDKPECILEYLDRSINLSTQADLYGGNTNHPDCWWDNYTDKQLNIIDPNQLTMSEKKQLENFYNSKNTVQASPTFISLYEDERNALMSWNGDDNDAPDLLFLANRIIEQREQIELLSKEIDTLNVKKQALVPQNTTTSSDKKPWESKKFWSLIFGGVGIIVAQASPELKPIVDELTLSLTVYLAGQSAIDVSNVIKK